VVVLNSGLQNWGNVVTPSLLLPHMVDQPLLVHSDMPGIDKQASDKDVKGRGQVCAVQSWQPFMPPMPPVHISVVLVLATALNTKDGVAGVAHCATTVELLSHNCW
jgi:hypothetical protein